MNRHLGASCTLSVLLVVLFAVLFYRPEPGEGPSGALRPRAEPRANPLTGRASPPGQAATGPPREAIATRQVGTSAPKTGPTAPLATADRPKAEAPLNGYPPSVERPARRPDPTARPGFATARPGETLGDLAARVYGPGGSADLVWRANRDQLASADTPLRPGMVLRTP